MTKRSEQTFKIEEITPLDKAVKLVIKGKEYLVSKSFYTDNYFYPDKEIEPQELTEIKEADRLLKAEMYLEKLLSNKRYTVKEVKDKLRGNYDLKDKEISDLMRPYLESQILSDKDYASDYLEAKSSSGYGLDYISDRLRTKGINLKEVLSKEEIAPYEKIAEEKASLLLSKKDDLSKPKPAREKQLTTYLITRGFTLSESKRLVTAHLERQSPESEEKAALLQEKKLSTLADKYYLFYKRKETDEYKLKSKLISKLLSLGYSTSVIYAIITKKGYFNHD